MRKKPGGKEGARGVERDETAERERERESHDKRDKERRERERDVPLHS